MPERTILYLRPLQQPRRRNNERRTRIHTLPLETASNNRDRAMRT